MRGKLGNGVNFGGNGFGDDLAFLAANQVQGKLQVYGGKFFIFHDLENLFIHPDFTEHQDSHDESKSSSFREIQAFCKDLFEGFEFGSFFKFLPDSFDFHGQERAIVQHHHDQIFFFNVHRDFYIVT